MLKSEIKNNISSSGFGNQTKYWDNEYLIKADTKYEESSNEVTAYNVCNILNIDSVKYEKCLAVVDNSKLKGCRSKTFLRENEQFINAYSLAQFSDVVYKKNMSSKEKFSEFVGKVSQYTKIHEYVLEKYILNMTLVDFLICNCDRHYGNFGLIYCEKTGVYRPAPLFDNGQSFLYCDKLIDIADVDIAYSKFKTTTFSTTPLKNCIDIDKSISLIGIERIMSLRSRVDEICFTSRQEKVLNITLSKLIKHAKPEAITKEF